MNPKTQAVWILVVGLVCGGLGAKLLDRVMHRPPPTAEELAQQARVNAIFAGLNKLDVVQIKDPRQCVYRFHLITAAERNAEDPTYSTVIWLSGPTMQPEPVFPSRLEGVTNQYAVTDQEWSEGVRFWLDPASRPVPTDCEKK